MDRRIPDISVVVPVYRSEASLPALAAAVDKALNAAKLSYELILVNDGSPDRSWLIIKQLATRYPTIIGFCHRRNFGQDNAILTGIRNASGRAVVIMDDDLQHSPDDIPKLYEEMNRSGADVVYAHFIEKKQKAWKRIGSWINGKFAEWLIDKPANIYMSPFKIVRGEVAELIGAFDGPFPYVDSLLFQVTNRFSFIRDRASRKAGRTKHVHVREIPERLEPSRVLVLGKAAAAGELGRYCGTADQHGGSADHRHCASGLPARFWRQRRGLGFIDGHGARHRRTTNALPRYSRRIRRTHAHQY